MTEQNKRSARDYYDVPTEYGGAGGANRRRPDGRAVPMSTAARAQEMRRAGLRPESTSSESTGRRLG